MDTSTVAAGASRADGSAVLFVDDACKEFCLLQ